MNDNTEETYRAGDTVRILHEPTLIREPRIGPIEKIEKCDGIVGAWVKGLGWYAFGELELTEATEGASRTEVAFVGQPEPWQEHILNLRNDASFIEGAIRWFPDAPIPRDTVDELVAAADFIAKQHQEIERLRTDLVFWENDGSELDAAKAEIERLREALTGLTSVIRMKGSLDYVTGWQAFQKAERALKEPE